MIPGGTIVNRLKRVTEKRADLLEAFFEKCIFEVRITIGPRWEDYILRSRPEHGNLLHDLARHKQFERYSEVHGYRIVKLFSESLQQAYPIKMAVGL